jgi:hypothetical protein
MNTAASFGLRVDLRGDLRGDLRVDLRGDLRGDLTGDFFDLRLFFGLVPSQFFVKFVSGL